jgi:hypothetical protein
MNYIEYMAWQQHQGCLQRRELGRLGFGRQLRTLPEVKRVDVIVSMDKTYFYIEGCATNKIRWGTKIWIYNDDLTDDMILKSKCQELKTVIARKAT